MRRLAALLLTSSLALTGAALSPAQAADDLPRLPEVAGLLEAPAPAGLPTRAIIRDPAADADGPPDLRPLAELRRVAYRTPSTTAGTLTVRSTWASLRNVDRRGGLAQRLVSIIDAGSGDRTWTVTTTNRRDTFRLFGLDAEGNETRIRPEQVTVRRTYGAGGSIAVTVSTEWLTARRVALTTFSSIGIERGAFDVVDPVALRVGPRR